ncbi:hypothetical protein V1504DRAFT_472177 [Lipomyces starkeyi]
MYTWCKARGYYRLWAYLYVNWYCEEQWKLWERAADPAEIPIVKTTMIAESHWRTLKHDYFHRFNRPRVDLVVWILTFRVLPNAVHRMKLFRMDNSACSRLDGERHSRSSGRKNPSGIFRNCQSSNDLPFCKDERLILRPEYAPRVELVTQGLNRTARRRSQESVIDFSESESERDEDEDDEQEAIPMEIQVAEFRKMMQDVTSLFEEQVAKGNDEFVERFMVSNEANRLCWRKSSTKPQTWGRCRHPATMFLK